MKKLFAYSLIMSGFFGISGVRAVSYTHFLNYTNDDNSNNAKLSAEVTFENSSGFANADTSDVRGDSIQNGFTTYITYTYTPVPGGASYSLDTSDITFYTFVRSGTSVDYDFDPTLKSQLTNLQFSNAGGSGDFNLTIDTGVAFAVQARVGSGTANDFTLSSTSQFPAPLPILGIVPAFSSIRRLKKRYNSILNR